MRKRILSTLLAMALTIASLGGNGVDSYALSLAETQVTNQDEGVVSDVEVFDTEPDESVASDVAEQGTKLEKAVVSDVHETVSNLLTDIVFDEEDENIVVFSAVKGDESLDLTVNREEYTSELVYKVETADDTIELYAKIDNESFDYELEFDNSEELSFDEFEDLCDDAVSLWEESVLLWNEDIEKAELTWDMIGFSDMDKYCLSLIENEADDEAEITDDADENIADDSDADLFEVITEDDEESVTEGEAIASADEEIIDEDVEDIKEEVASEDEEVTEEDISEETEVITEVLVEEEELDDYHVEVPFAERVVLNYSSIDIKVGESIQLEANVFPENASQEVTWGMINDIEDAASINITNSGLLLAKSENRHPLYVYAEAGSVRAKVEVNVQSIESIHDTDENGNPTKVFDTEDGVLKIRDGIWVGGFEKENNYYTGKAVPQNLTVYYKGEKLTLNKDYSLSYKNNTSACLSNQINSASVTITMKGMYSGKKTLYYGILPAQMSEVSNDSENIALVYSGKDQKYVPTLTYNGKKLANNKDFTIEYVSGNTKGNPLVPEVIEYKITGKGNFAGTKTGNYYITQKSVNVSKAAISLKSSIAVTKSCGADNINATTLNLKIKMPGELVFSDIDSSLMDVSFVYPSVIPGTGKVIIEGNGVPYVGQIIKTFKVTAGYNLANIVEISNFMDERQYYPNIEYNKQVGVIPVILTNNETGATLVEGTDYEAVYSNINKVGTAKVTYKGKGIYTGAITKSFKLTNEEIGLTATCDSVSYVPGGVKTKVNVYYERLDPFGISKDTYTLIENVDYIVKYANNNAVGDAKVTVIPKGNYAKYSSFEMKYSIAPASISACSVTVADKAYSGRANSFKSVPVVIAPNGKKLVAGKDYDRNIEYIYDDYDVNNNPAAGTNILVKIKGIGNYAGSTVCGSYILYDKKQYGLNKLYIAVNDQMYTGKQIEPKLGSDIKVYLNANDLKNKVNAVENPENYVRIVSYNNNIKAGKGTIVLGGAIIGVNGTENKYAGTKKVSFKILKKNYDYNTVRSLTLSDKSLVLTSTTAKATATITAIINSGEDKPDNSTLIWKTSDPKVVSISVSDDRCVITAEAKGSAVISCTTQEGVKKASCQVTSIMKPLESVNIYNADDPNAAVSSVDLEVDQSVKLIAVPKPADAYMPGGSAVTWSSMNPEIASIDSDGNVTAHTKGSATIKAQIGDKTGYCFINIGIISVTKFGAIPDDNIDDTAAFNKAIQAAMKNYVLEERTVFVPDGIYNISVNGEAGIDLNNAYNLNIKMASGAVLKTVKADHSCMQGVFTLDRAKNVTIEGGKIDGNRSKISFSENFYGIMCVRSSDINIINVNVANVNGDGIYFGKNNETANKNERIKISGCTVDKCARNNIALVNVNDITIENTTSKGATGYFSYTVNATASGLGLDIEPNGGQKVTSVKVINCSFSGNREDFGIHCHVNKSGCSQSSGITLDGCSFSGMIYIDCGTNLEFKNTKRRPGSYYDRRKNSYTFPD